ncbi:MAG: phosphopyruvate hydratase, partial [Candidatus Pacearchaeota archaeon]
IKPNQCGSLIEVKKISDYCSDKKIKKIFSHRSGETEETILIDLAIGLEADFVKIGSIGKGRDSKIKRLKEIEKEVKRA